jgi:diaminohydroxyphosphoribosylaminopyrimidine deaminase/5-amino-6-(5-phosphoribosylamino)uracil reductase
VNDEAAMSLALAEAVKGLGRTHPNPAVGAVLVKHGRVIATGYHAKAGGPHAEAVALAKAGKRAKGATLYSTLEPCNHFGRTPPCSEAIIEAGVKRVVFGSSDPNPLVNGKGLRRIKAAGIAVTAHVLRESADALNEPFLKAMRTGLPWVTAKAAITLDGKLATSTGKSKWISS